MEGAGLILQTQRDLGLRRHGDDKEPVLWSAG
jgi:hypothetical protein